MSTLKSCCIFMLTLTLVSAAALAVPAGYQMESYAIYNSTGLGQVRGLAFDNLGNLYASHLGTPDVGWANGSITRINSTAIDTRWSDGIGRAGRLVWGGGTAFGDSLYVTDPVERMIKMVNNTGVSANLAYVATQPLPLDIDRNGAYGGHMYTGTWGTDGLYSISTSGSVNKLGTFPDEFSGTDSGGIMTLKFAPGQRYGGKMYVGWEAWDSSYPSAVLNGIHAIETNGDSSLFASLSHVREMAFDTSGTMFNNDLFAIGTKPGVAGMHLWRIDELGNAEDFMTVGWGTVEHIAFGSDGAMYLSAYRETAGNTEIYRISEIPEPASLLLMALGGMFLAGKKQKNRN